MDKTTDLDLVQMPGETGFNLRVEPRPLKIIGTHFYARTTRVFVCFAR
jgi:hypothetical protein